MRIWEKSLITSLYCASQHCKFRRADLPARSEKLNVRND